MLHVACRMSHVACQEWYGVSGAIADEILYAVRTVTAFGTQLYAGK